MTNMTKEEYVENYLRSQVFPRMMDCPGIESTLPYFKKSAFGQHYVRFIETYYRIFKHLNLSGKRVAETGHLSGISEYLRDVKGVPVQQLEGDFRYRIEAPDSCVDVLFSFEVFEHIKDQDHARFDDLVLFNFSGIRAFAREMFRVVAPGGVLVLTTPNPCSLITLDRLLQFEEPWVYWPHVREYTPKTVIQILTEAGFRNEHFETYYGCFFFEDRTEVLKRMFADRGAPQDNRGDGAFYIFHK